MSTEPDNPYAATEADVVPPSIGSAIDENTPYTRDRTFWGMTVTQFLGAFNDNVFKQLVLLLCTAFVLKIAAKGDNWQSLAQAAFALPFVLFSGFGGYLSDRYSKRQIVVLCKVAEIVVMAAGMLVLLMWSPDTEAGLIGLCCVLFLMGAQSAFFGPAKYGILPEMLREKDLPAANGIIQMTTFLAIIFGTVVAGKTSVAFTNQLWVVCAICIGIAVVGTITSLLIRRTPVAQPNLRLTSGALWINKDMRSLLWRDRPLLFVLLTTTLFWFVGGVVLPGVNGLGKFGLGLPDDRTSRLAAMMGLGIAVGCPLAGWLSKGRTAFGLTRIGALGISISLGIVGGIQYANLPARTVEVICLVSLILLGVSAGLFAVPLQVFLQARPPKEQKGRMIGSMNLVNWIGILSATVFYQIMTTLFGKGTPITFIAVGLMTLPIAVISSGYWDSLEKRPDETDSGSV